MPWQTQKGHLFCSEPTSAAATAVPSNSKNLWDMKISLVQFEDMRACVWSIKSTVDTQVASWMVSGVNACFSYGESQESCATTQILSYS